MKRHLLDNLDTTCFTPIANRADYEKWQSKSAARLAIEAELAKPGSFSIKGKCSVCNTETDMQADYGHAYDKFPDGRLQPNWRETLVCPRCWMNNRERLAMHMLKYLPDFFGSTVYLPETASGTARWLANNHSNITLSEYRGPDHARGEIIDGIRNEDLCDLAMRDGSFHYVICKDILEHVPNPYQAISEMFRILKPGGVLVLTVPFYETREKNLQTANMDEAGKITHLVTPEYHGNPKTPEKRYLVFTKFGWELLEDLLGASDGEAIAAYAWNRDYCYLGSHNMIFLAMKQ